MKQIAILILSLFSLNAFAQESCGTIVTPENEAYFQKQKEIYQNFNFHKSAGTVTEIGIKIHIVRTSAGLGGPSMNLVQNAIDRTNAVYINSNIEFFICGEINYINNSTFHNFNSSNQGILTNTYDVPKVINLYLMGSVSTSTGPVCGYTYLPPGGNHIFIANNCLSGATLPHELGHYFSLLHTHGGSNTGTTYELVNGNNCTTHGDRLCDTPADPNLSWSGMMSGCTYVGTVRDANGDLYRPMVENIMAYSPGGCKDRFSAQQYAQIAASYAADRNYLSCNNRTSEFEANTPTSCAGSEVQFTDLTQGNPTAWFWTFPGGTPAESTEQNPVVVYENPGTYDVHLAARFGNNTGLESKMDYININPSFDVELEIIPDLNQDGNGSATVNPLGGKTPYTFEWNTNPVQTEKTARGLNVGTYTVKISDAEGCSVTKSFEIFGELSQEEIDSKIKIYPNPSSSIFNLEMNGLSSNKLQMAIFDVFGKRVLEENVLRNEAGNLELNLFNQNSGIYILVLKTDYWTSRQKIVLSR